MLLAHNLAICFVAICQLPYTPLNGAASCIVVEIAREEAKIVRY